jgi:hypothetical protein
MIAEASSAKSRNWHFRLKASLIHLAASAALAIIVASIIFALWYPSDYRSISGGTDLFVLITSVDVIIGPLVTLVIFDKRKPIRLIRLDMVIVVILQLAALGYGLNTLSISRPVALALEVDRFRVVAAMDVYTQELPMAAPEFRHLSLTGPRLVRSPLPSEVKPKSDALELALKGFDIGTRPSLWTQWDAAARSEALSNAKPIAVLISRLPNRQTDIEHAIAATGLPAEKLVFIPMIAFHGEWVALLDTNGDVVGFAPVNGFEN